MTTVGSSGGLAAIRSGVADFATAHLLEPARSVLLVGSMMSGMASGAESSKNVILSTTTVKETGVTTVLVTHDRDEAFALADRVGVLHQGRLLQLGSREDVFFRPETEAVAEIVGMENRWRGVVDVFDGEHATIKTRAGMIHAKTRLEVGAKVVACIRPEEVSLTFPSCGTRDSNRLKGKVVAVSSGMTQHRVSLDCDGTSLVALVERTRYPAELASCEGHELMAIFSSDAVHLIRGDESY